MEARDVDALGRGMMPLGIRFARAVNRALRRKGPVDRYHAKVLKSPTQVRNAIRYVLLNARRHAAQARKSRQLPGPVRLDPASHLVPRVRLDVPRGLDPSDVPGRV